MRTYKLKVNASLNEIFEIEKERFEKQTETREPYYKYNEKGEMLGQYAVCPRCHNPIEIIGLYKELKNTEYPYGKHYPKSIKDLAEYNNQAYEFCPYAKKRKKVTKNSRKKYLTEFEKSIYELLREHFDKVIYILSKLIDIKITNRQAKEMLILYVKNKSYQYPLATPNNLPYLFAYINSSKPLYGQPILKDSGLYKALKEQFGDIIEFTKSKYYKNYEILGVKQGNFLDIQYSLLGHNIKVKDNKDIEKIEFSVSTGNACYGDLKNIYTKVIEIDQNYFFNIIKKAEKENYRNEKLLDIAKEVMQSL